jgi:hypothetical protein
MFYANSFDWSLLDRNLIVEMVGYLSSEIVGKNLPVTEFTHKIRTLLRQLEIPIKVRTQYGKKTEKNSVWVGGLYDSSLDQENKNSITVILQFNPNYPVIKVSKKHFNTLCYGIADTILHEIIHLRQYRRRNYAEIPGYHSTAQSGKKRAEQTYLGHTDEIDAYAFNIACKLQDKFKGDIKKIINHLNSNQQRKNVESSLKMYLEVFDYNHDHKIIKRLKKKVINYMPNAIEIGKPYRTTDWLKK